MRSVVDPPPNVTVSPEVPTLIVVALLHKSAVVVEVAPPRVKVPLATDRSAPTAKAVVDD